MNNRIELTKMQKKWFNIIYEWYFDSKYYHSYIIMAGYAGTGKSTILGYLVDEFHKKSISIACATFTGKASYVLSTKIRNYSNNYIGTIHGLIYKPVINKDGLLSHFERRQFIDYDVIIIDECSMIDEKIFKDLLSFNVPIIFIGDSAQLPPVSSDHFNIFENTEFELTEIHRQAEKSPIIQLSMRIRNGEYIECGNFGKGCAKMSWHDIRAQKTLYNHNPKDDDIILCGMNKTRIALNKMIRKKEHFNRPEPELNDKIVCLQNNHNLGVMNGQIGFVEDIQLFENFAFIMKMSSGNYITNHCVFKKGFDKLSQKLYYETINKSKIKNKLKEAHFEKLDLFDFGYALSVHKSQGSSWNRVILIEERNSYQSDDDFCKWYYTGVTRSENKLLIIEDF